MGDLTKQALTLVDQGMSAYKAAKQLGIQPPTVYRALLRREAAQIKAGQMVKCDCCGSLVKPAQINRVAEPRVAYTVDPRIAEISKLIAPYSHALTDQIKAIING